MLNSTIVLSLQLRLLLKVIVIIIVIGIIPSYRPYRIIIRYRLTRQ